MTTKGARKSNIRDAQKDNINYNRNMSKTQIFSEKLLNVFFFLLPLHAFLVTFFNFGLGFHSSAISAWREIVLIVLTLLATTVVIKKKKLPRWSIIDTLIASYFLLGLIFLIIQREEVNQWILGARYDFEFFYFYWLIRVFDFGSETIKKFLKSIIAAAVIVVIFGIILQFLPQDFLTQFGYSTYQDEWSKGSAVFSCHYLEFYQNFCRMQSTFGSPGRFGSYLLFISALSGTFLLSTQKKSKQILWGLLFLASITGLILTLSRANWIGFAAMLGVALFPLIKGIKKRVIGLVAVVTLIMLAFGGSLIKPIFLRSASSFEHLQLSLQGMALAEKYPLGMGLGKVGPASFSFSKLLTENAYLQVILEMGFLGGTLFLLILVVMLIKLREQYQKSQSRFTQILSYTCFLTLIGLMAAGFFIHSFEETSLMLMLFGLTGLLQVQQETQIGG